MSCPSCFLFPLHPLLFTRRCVRLFKTSRRLHRLPKFSPSKGGLITAKLPRKKKGSKRAALAAGLAPPPARRPQLANLAQNTEDVSSGTMQNMQAGGGQWPTEPPPYQDRGRLRGVPHPPNVNEGYTAPADASSPHLPGLGPHPFNPYPSIEKSDIPEGSYHQIQRPMFGATTPLPSAPFPRPPAFPCPPPFNPSNSTSWPPAEMQDSGIAPPMPHVNPRFFNPAMGGMPPSPFPMIPFNPLLQFQGAQPMSTFAGSPAAQSSNPRRRRQATPPVKIPVPTEAYMQQASQTPKWRSRPQPLLIILDLNGTLIFRKHKKYPPSFKQRAGLEIFLDELTHKYSVMIWSSSKPATVGAVCQKLFPEDKKDSIVAMWGRDRFGLNNAQYNSKLQVYKELRKVWADSSIQAAYPGREPPNTSAAPNHSRGKFSKRNKKRQQCQQNSPAESPPVGRWDQTNTILIDDSKLKALSEPYNILEIPEFTGDLSIDESTLFANVLKQLDILSHHDDVSKMLRLVNELAEKEGKPVLDMEFPSSERGIPFQEEDVSDGGVKLVPRTNLKGNGKKTAAAKQVQTLTNTAEGADITAQKKAAKKARKRAKKEAKKAAQGPQQPAAETAASAAQPANTAHNDPITETTAPNAATSVPAPVHASTPATNPDGSVKLTKGQRRQQALAARREAKARAQQPAPTEPVPAETEKSYDLRRRESRTTVPVTEGDVDSSVAPEPIDSVFKQVGGRQRDRSPSSASDSSRNSLLDRLEDGLGIHRY